MLMISSSPNSSLRLCLLIFVKSEVALLDVASKSEVKWINKNNNIKNDAKRYNKR